MPLARSGAGVEAPGASVSGVGRARTAPGPEQTASTHSVEFVAGGGNVLVLSMRSISNVVGYCAMYEFEDLISELLHADRVAPLVEEGLERSRRVYKLTRYLTRSNRLAEVLAPRAGAVRLEREYELFLPVFNHPHELFNLNAVQGWREKSRFAAAYICEAWEARLPEYLLELLQPFDHIFLGVEGARESVARITGKPCTYLPMGVDALRFAPKSAASERPIDVCGIGRRSDVTHSALLDFAKRDGRFYYYDTMRRAGGARSGGAAVTFGVIDAGEHRLLLSNLLKRSKYFIANRAWADTPGLTRGKDEIACRFYEGAAAGAVMLGEPPDTEDFRSEFDWPDAVVRTPFNAPDIADTIRALDKDPSRTARIRTNGVVNALLRHDWSHRLLELLKVASFPATPGMRARASELEAAAARFRAASV
jgi:Glycosyl transferases group 1